MSEQAQEQDLTPAMQEMMAQMAQMRAELDSLKGRTYDRAQANNRPLPPPSIQAKPEVSTTRRKLLRRLAGGLVAGLAVGGIDISLPQDAEAKLSSNPVGNGLTGRVGMLVMPPGSTMSGVMGGSSTNKVGLLVSGDTSFNVNPIAPTVNGAIIAYTSNNGTAITGMSQTGTAIYGQSTSNFAVHGITTNSNGVQGESTSGNGVYGTTAANDQTPSIAGVYGNASSTDQNSEVVGVYGSSSGGGGCGVYGTGNTGVYGTGNTGVYGTGNTGVNGSGRVGVRGDGSFNGGIFSANTNVSGTLPQSTYIGVIGTAVWGLDLSQFSPDYRIGVYGLAANNFSNAYAGYFEGNVHVNGTLSKLAGSFKIDHPLDPANKYLYHSFVESPDMMNIYNGIITLDEQGQATVEMPEWFEALNSDFRYQLTSIGGASPNLHISEKLAERKFKIAGGLPGQEVSWMVTGIRQDAWAKAHRIPVEEAKTDKEKGKYLHPEVFGQPVEMSVHPRPDEGR